MSTCVAIGSSEEVHPRACTNLAALSSTEEERDGEIPEECLCPYPIAADVVLASAERVAKVPFRNGDLVVTPDVADGERGATARDREEGVACDGADGHPPAWRRTNATD